MRDKCMEFAAGQHLAGDGTIAEQLAELEAAVENGDEWKGTAYEPFEWHTPEALLDEIYCEGGNLYHWLQEEKLICS